MTDETTDPELEAGPFAFAEIDGQRVLVYVDTDGRLMFVPSVEDETR